VWADQDWRTIITASDLLNKRNGDKEDDDRQMSG
jgi:hypothetical protein